MTNIHPQDADRLRQGFRYLNKFMVGLFRLGLGGWVNAWPEVGGQIMVIANTGRKTGLPRKSPVNYALIDGELYCVAGFGIVADWYRNLLANPKVEVWLPQGWFSGIAEDITGCPESPYLLRQVIIASGFAARIFGIDHEKITDEELARATEGYRLVHIHRTGERTGPGGPSDLAWVWPLATFLLLPLALRRRKRRK
jgi:deazaflavin-dependent oxidoreductase (nitroreductase family)